MTTTLEQHRAWKKANPDKVKAYREKHQPVAQAKLQQYLDSPPATFVLEVL